jgi:hypothetical protein
MIWAGRPRRALPPPACGARSVQNEPNFDDPGRMSGGDAQPTKRQSVQNKPNWACAGAADGGDCAKRSQTWGDWDMWAKVVVWGVPRPGVKRAKRTQFGPGRTWLTEEIVQNEPNLGTGGPRLWIGDCGLQIERRRPGRAPEAECAKRTQFHAGAGG